MAPPPQRGTLLTLHALFFLCLAYSSLARLFGDDGPIHVVKTPEGDVFDCVRIEDQEGLKHPLLKDHKIQSLENSKITEFVNDTNLLSSLIAPFSPLNCPYGTIPQLRSYSSSPNHSRFSHSNPKNTSSMKFVSSSPSTVPTVDAGHFLTTSATGVFGLLDIWSPKVENSANEFSGSFVSVGAGSDQILAGWLVYPGLYNDNFPRFTIANTKDRFKTKSCFNAACGFIVLDTTIGLGLRFASVSTSSSISSVSIAIQQDSTVNGWVLTVNQQIKVGYWPNSLFNTLNSGVAQVVSWTGRIANSYPSGRYTKTQMGNGILASSDSAAAISYLIYVDTAGQLQLKYTTPNAPATCYTERFTLFSASGGTYSRIFYGGSGYDSGCNTIRKPPVRPPPPPPPQLTEIRSLFLNAPIDTKRKNKYFRYASYRYTGDAQKPNWDLTASVDFVAQDDVGPIEDQGECNACWAFAPAAALESLYANATGYGAPSVSKQQILDCAPTSARNGSCGGGWVTDAFEFMATTGLASRVQYPYVGNQQNCYTKNTPDVNVYKISMYEEVDFYGSFGLILAVQNQPVVVNIQASSNVFQTYKQGVFDSPLCFTDFVDHSVVVVGYKLFGANKPYWILKNSFGESWGEKGYMRIAYTGGDGICGMHTTPAYYPVLPHTVGSKSPCGPPNPCGGGTCTTNKITGRNLCSSCPSGFIAVTNIDGTQTCATLNPCQTKSFNPCGSGMCVNDLKGSYTCICPPGFAQDLFANVDANTCVPATSSNKTLFYTVQSKDTCAAISVAFRLTLTQLQRQNPRLNCNSLRVGTLVNVTQSVNWRNCNATYSWNTGDSCLGIQSLFGITRDTLLRLNPGLDCTRTTPGYQVCVRQGTPIDFDPPCSTFYAVQNGDSCQSIIAKFKLNPFNFFILNRGINCQSLDPSDQSGVFSEQVCIDSSVTGAASQCKGGRIRKVLKRDTCARIITLYFGRSFNRFKKCNKGVACSRLRPGTPYCVC